MGIGDWGLGPIPNIKIIKKIKKIIKYSKLIYI